MPTRIKYFGIAAYEITIHNGQKILIDPCLNDNPSSPIKVSDLEQVDLLLVTHLAFDHFGDTAEIARIFNCPVICGAEVKYVLVKMGVNPEQIRTITWNVQLLVSGIRVRSVRSMHASMGTDPDGNFISGVPMGYIIYCDPNVRIYHSGDTALYSDLKLIGELYQPNIGLISCCEMEKEYLEAHGLKDHHAGEMNGDEGAMAAIWLGVEYALCNHCLYPENHPDVKKFVAILSNRYSDEEPLVKPVVLKPGEGFSYETGNTSKILR